MKIGNYYFDWKNHTYVMGILNVTPDSFSDGGKHNKLDTSLKYTEQMIQEGASIIDVGGESTRPDYLPVSQQEEMERVVPVIEGIKKNFDIPVSIDTYKSEVARQALTAGADLVNDIWGFQYDEKMAQVVKDFDAAVCLMHNRKIPDYQDFLRDWKTDLEKSIQIALKAGIEKDRIILDPGVGFGKTYEMNLQAINHLDELHELGYPLLLGTSRKSVIGITLDLPVDQREEGTAATTVMAVMKGCSFVRVHNVKANVRVIKMTEAVLKS